jgi:hypothetical protein
MFAAVMTRTDQALWLARGCKCFQDEAGNSREETP